MEAQAEVTISRAIDNFWTSKEYKDEKALFMLDAYDERKHVIRDEVTSRYPKLNLDFLDEVFGVSVVDPKNVS